MNAQSIINRAIRLTHTNVADYSVEQSVEDLNLVYQDMIDEIVVVTKGDYFWDRWMTDTVPFQSEYGAEKLGIAPDDLDIKKVNKVFIKYSESDENFTPVRYQNPWVLTEHPDYYKVHQSKLDPFFYIQDTSVFIYPAPSEIIECWMELFVIHKPADITENTLEDDIEIPSQFHKTISEGLRMYIYQSQGKINESQVAESNYNRGVQNMTTFMRQRYNQPQKRNLVNLDKFR